MPPTIGGIGIDPQGQTLTVSITPAAKVYTNAAGTALAAFPMPVSSRTSFFVASAQQFTISCKFNGAEIAGPAGQTLVVQIDQGQFEWIAPTIDRPAEDSTQGATYVAVADVIQGVPLNSPQDVQLRYGPLLVPLVAVTEVPGASSLREQDDIVFDPDDSDATRRYKFYFSTSMTGVASDGSVSPPDRQLWVKFSADGVTWTTPPTRCVMANPIDAGNKERRCQDPSVVQTLTIPAKVHRDGSSKMHLFCEDSSNFGANGPGHTYVYESTDGVNWTSLGAAIVKGTLTSDWDHILCGSPTARHDGTNYLVTYEGRKALAVLDSTGIVTGTTVTALVKSASNPIWNPKNDTERVGASVVLDSWFLDGTGRIMCLCHAGFLDATHPTRMFRGSTTNLSPATWVDGDIKTLPGTGDVDANLQSDFTRDNSSPKSGVVTSDYVADLNLVRQRFVDARGYRPAAQVRAPVPDIQVFPTTGSFTWTKPTDPALTIAEILVQAGGGGGGSGRRGAAGSVRTGGAGGAGGAWTKQTLLLSTLGATETVVVGVGGAGGAAISADDTNGNTGTIGGDSAFGAWFRSGGGNGGTGGNTTTTSGGVGGTGDRNGAAGGAGSATGLVGNAGPSASWGGAGGGSGGGLTAANAESAGGAGGNQNALVGTGTAVRAGGTAGAVATAGSVTTTPTGVREYACGTGGGGGGSSLSTNAGAGANGDKYGGGGGGGGASVNATGNSGKGGDGGQGVVIVVCR